MKKVILVAETVVGLLCFSLFLKIDWMFSLCVLVFSSIYLFGIIDSGKNPQRIDAHLMVGGTMFFISMIFAITNNLPHLEFSTAHLLIIVMGLVGLIQALILRLKFK
ncbi:MAG TPA: hypothetical protein PLP64_07890 [Pseudothermotoga sp.]|mgnify:CR=1 FL=1|nr:hypothetical protein [Pseudothermotoga sp.]HOK84130.1 hypothetical protein [Pseudothermotoga sp.]HPP69129.1 hypothetical protein [Pseudothermotoga sp.]